MQATVKDTSVFHIIQIENTAFCNRTCPWCPQSHLNFMPTDKMEWKTLEKIVDGLVEMDYKNRIHPYGNGEPLTDADFMERVKYIREKLPKCFIYIATNGDLIGKPHNFIDLWKSGVNSIQCNHYDDRNEHLRSLPNSGTVKINGKFHHVEVKHENLGDLRTTFYNRAGNIKISSITPAKTCWFPGVKLYFNYLGDMLICCADWTFRDKVGNIHEQSLEELVSSPKLKQYREYLSQGRADELPLCSQCNLIRHQEVI